MTEETKIDQEAAHRQFSTHCFNETWGFLDKADRTPKENQEMILTALASLWHWTQRSDCTNTNLSIGYWQASRVYASAGLPEEARRYGRLCLDISQGEGIAPFYRAYAYEALARAESIAGNRERTADHLAQAQRLAQEVVDAEAQKQLLADLASIRS
jgi:hypothetical protein